MPEERIVEKLGDIPVLNDGWATALDYYTKIKELNSVTRFTLGIAETSVKTAADISTPVVGHYQSQIDNVNAYACTKLEELESKYPLIKQPSGEVKDACLEYVQPVVDKVKPVINCVQNAVVTSKQRVDNMKETGNKLVTGARDFGVNTVTGARDLGINTVTGAVTMTLNTPPGRLITRTVDGALCYADDLVERYIPEEEKEGTSDEEYMDAEHNPEPEEPQQDQRGDIPQMELMEPSPERVVVHFRSVSKKLRRRMFQKAMKDYQGAKVRTFSALGKLTNHVNLIEYAQTNLGQAKGKASDVWAKIIEEEKQQEANSGSEEAGRLEEHIIHMGRVLVQQVRHGVDTMERISQETGQFVRHPISKSKEYKDLLINFTSIHSLSDIQKIPLATLDNIKLNLTAIRKNIWAMMDRSSFPEWMVSGSVNIDVDDIGLEVDDGINVSLQQQEGEEPQEEQEPQGGEEPQIVGNHVSG